MTVRAVNPYTSYQVLLNLQRAKADMADLSEQISSGSRLTSLGKDPTASALVLDLQGSIDRNNAYIGQAESAGAVLTGTETALTSLNEEITQILEIGVSGLGDSATAAERTSLATEVEGIKTVILSLANMETSGKYLFAGTRTTTKPFSESTSGEVTYAGDGNSIVLDISSSTSISTNLSGETVFLGGGGQGSSTDLFQQIADLQEGLENDDVDQIQVAYDNLETILDSVNACLTDVGVRQTTLDQISTNLGSYNDALESLQSTHESVDYSAASVEYAQAQLVQEASLSVLSNQSDLTLFDYLA
jgi:flagellar hook-associated protein 3 FlgL